MVPYVRSKVMAERAAWDFVKSLPAEQAFELATVCPSTVFGPVLSPYDCASADILKKIITRELPMLPGCVHADTAACGVGGARSVAAPPTTGALLSSMPPPPSLPHAASHCLPSTSVSSRARTSWR